MAEYYAVLSKAVAGLETNTSEARRAVYDKARNALISQLKAIDPPLPTAEISRQRLELEEAIRRVERESASSAPMVADRSPAEAATAEGRQASSVGGMSPQDVFRRAIQDAGRRGGAAPPLERPPTSPRAAPPSYDQAPDDGDRTEERMERAPPAPYTPPRGYSEKRQPGGEPRLAPDYDWEGEEQAPPPPRPAYAEDVDVPPRRGRGYGPDDDADVMGRRARPSRLPAILLLVLIVVMVGGLAALGWSQRAVLSDLLASFDAGTAEAPPAQVTIAGDNQVADSAAASAKDADRLPNGEGADKSVRVVDAPATESSPDAEAPPLPSVTAALPPAQEPSAEMDTLVAQKAVLYEEPVDNAAADQGVVAINAAVTWSFLADGPDGPEISASIDIPDRKMNVKLSVRRNTDESLPASHLVEVVVDTPADFPGKGISSVPRLVFKQSEEARGQPLIGATAKITDGFFWIALSGADADVVANMAMIKERGWIDLPMVYDTGQRAILTIEKGIPGERVFDKALAAWSG